MPSLQDQTCTIVQHLWIWPIPNLQSWATRCSNLFGHRKRKAKRYTTYFAGDSEREEAWLILTPAENQMYAAEQDAARKAAFATGPQPVRSIKMEPGARVWEIFDSKLRHAMCLVTERTDIPFHLGAGGEVNFEDYAWVTLESFRKRRH